MKAFIVTGPQSSGTRMMTRALILSGCFEIADVDELPVESGSPVVIHRSIPHAGRWPNWWGKVLEFNRADYEVQPIIMSRDWNALCLSQIKRAFVGSREEAEENIRKAYQSATQSLPMYVMISYESFCLSPDFRRWLFTERFGLPKTPIDIWYANDQYYQHHDSDPDTPSS